MEINEWTVKPKLLYSIDISHRYLIDARNLNFSFYARARIQMYTYIVHVSAFKIDKVSIRFHYASVQTIIKEASLLTKDFSLIELVTRTPRET